MGQTERINGFVGDSSINPDYWRRASTLMSNHQGITLLRSFADTLWDPSALVLVHTRSDNPTVCTTDLRWDLREVSPQWESKEFA